MTTALLSLGANLGDPRAQVEEACRFFSPWVYASSSLYRTSPWGVVEQPDFVNMALLVRDEQTEPMGWLCRGQEAERRACRVRDVRWGPRTLDVDVIACWGEDGTLITSDTEELTLPHPFTFQRAFVMVPAVEVLRVHHPTGEFTALVEAAVADLSASDVASLEWVAAPCLPEGQPSFPKGV